MMKATKLYAPLIAVLSLALTMPLLSNAEDDEEGIWTPEERAAIRARHSPLPLQAAVCDIVGVGRVTDVSTNNWGEVAQLSVDNYWVGNPGSNTLSVAANRLFLPVSSTSIVFFATSYAMPNLYLGTAPRLSLLFKMAEYRQSREPREPWFYDNERSWFYATPENGELVAFASNIVTAAQISTNRLAFYELLRDGFRLNPPESRIHIDSEMAFIGCRFWMPTNFMAEVRSDPLLPTYLGDIINNYYKLETGHWLP